MQNASIFRIGLALPQDLNIKILSGNLPPESQTPEGLERPLRRKGPGRWNLLVLRIRTENGSALIITFAGPKPSCPTFPPAYKSLKLPFLGHIGGAVCPRSSFLLKVQCAVIVLKMEQWKHIQHFLTLDNFVKLSQMFFKRRMQFLYFRNQVLDYI